MRNYVAKKVTPPFYYYGGKTRLCRPILQLAPSRPIYVECFAGSLSVLLNRYRSEVEVACDVSTELINFYWVLVDRTEELIERLKDIQYERAALFAAMRAGTQGDDLTRAVNFFCQQRMSFASTGTSWSECHYKKAKWLHIAYDLRIVAERLKGVQILCRSAFDVLTEYDSPDTLFYCDPPYYTASRLRSEAKYLHEFSEWEHLKLLRLLKTLKGSVILSGYDHPTYNRELSGWNRKEFEVTGFHGPMKDYQESRRTEVVWTKPEV